MSTKNHSNLYLLKKIHHFKRRKIEDYVKLILKYISIYKTTYTLLPVKYNLVIAQSFIINRMMESFAL